jgi:riboflavin-specific deaminase-like protein
MRALLPHDTVVDLWDAYRPPTGDHVRINMVASADGAIADARGRSGSIGGAADREVFRILRAHTDVIVVGAGTARIEAYGPHRLPTALAGRRSEEGRPAPAAIAVVSASLDLDPAAPLFSEASTPTMVLTTARADATRRRALAQVAEVHVAGDGAVEPRRALAVLREAGHGRVLVEGGPSVNAGWLQAGLIDELCLTIAPSLLGETGPRLGGDLGTGVALSLSGLFVEGSELLLRYAVDTTIGTEGEDPGSRC